MVGNMKKILIDASGGKEWIGGLYYKKNITFCIMQNDYIMSHYKVYVMCEAEYLDFFAIDKRINVICIESDNKINTIKSILSMRRLKFDYIFPLNSSVKHKVISRKKTVGITWIPDFQHYVFPEFFTEEERQARTKEYLDIKNSSMPLVLSSQSAKTDFEHYVGKKDNVYVVPFVSYIEKEIECITASAEKEVMDKYNIEANGYICICNQFWKHKNHKVILEAIRILVSENKNYRFIMTGYPKDYRNPEYIKMIMDYMEDPDIKSCVKITGFVDRQEQIILMKNSRFIIQPSLFEGWGTVLEDAKILDKYVVLSDIPVHQEQKNNKCIMFNPYNAEDLRDKIVEVYDIASIGIQDNGIVDMYDRARKYSYGFQELLVDSERLCSRK